MKNKKMQKHHQPLHLHVENFFRRQYVVYVVLALVAIGLCKADNRLLTAVHHVAAEEFSHVGERMREEKPHSSMHFNLSARIPTISGQ